MPTSECSFTPDGSVCIGGNIFEVPPYIPPFDDRPNPTIDTSEVGTIPGVFVVSHTGEATYRMPLRLPRGRGGMTPELALSYRSGRGMGPLGAGWALEGMESITRCERNYAQDGYTAPVRFDDRDAFCLNGERLVPTCVPTEGEDCLTDDGATEYALERNDLSSIVSFRAEGTGGLSGPIRFEVTKPNGEVLRFGDDESTNVNVLAPSAFDVVHTWPLARITDRDGNYAEYIYEQVSVDDDETLVREYYATGILYAKHSSDTESAQAAVIFGYENRPDRLNVWRNGVQLQTNRRLNKVIVVSGYQNRHYNLSYESGDNGDPKQSRITSIQECVSRSWLEEPETCMPATTFEYDREGGFEPTQDVGRAETETETYAAMESIQAVFDYNGDGRDDLLVLDLSGLCQDRTVYIECEAGIYCPPYPSESNRRPADTLLLSDTDENGKPTFVEQCVYGCPHCKDQDINEPRKVNLQPIDWDGDGLNDDLLDLRDGVIYQQGENENGEPEYTSYDAPGFPTDNNVQTYLLDLDGDGLNDLLSCKDGEWAYQVREIIPGSVPTSFFGEAIDPFYQEGDASRPCPAAVSTGTQTLVGTATGPNGDQTFGGPRQYAQVVDVDSDGAQELMFVVDSRVGKYFAPRGELDLDDIEGHLTVDRYRVHENDVVFDFFYSQPTQGKKWEILDIDPQTRTASVENTEVPWQAKPIDMNGDGLQDFYWLDNCEDYDWSDSTTSPTPSDEICQVRGLPRLRSWLNKGGGFEGSDAPRFDGNYVSFPAFDILAPDFFEPEEVEGAFRLSRAIDYDGDGKQDILLPTGSRWSVLPSTGTGFDPAMIETDKTWYYRAKTELGEIEVFDEAPAWMWAQQELSSPTILDINGDGLSDLLTRAKGRVVIFGLDPVAAASINGAEFPQWQVDVRRGPSQPRLQSITNGIGEDTDITYGPLRVGENYQPKASGDTCVYPQSCRMPRGSVVTEYEVGTPLFKDRHYELDFEDARFDVQGRGFLGYARRTEELTALPDLVSGEQDQEHETVRTVYRFDNKTSDLRTGVYFNALTPSVITEFRIDSQMEYENEITIEAQGIELAVAPGTVYRHETQRLELASERHYGSDSGVVTRNWGRWVLDMDQYGNVTYAVEGVPDTDRDSCAVEADEGCTITGISYMHEEAGDAFDAAGLRHLPKQRTEAFFKVLAAWPWSDVSTANARTTAFDYNYPQGTLQRVTVEPGPNDPLGDHAYLRKDTEIDRDQYGNVIKTTTTGGTESGWVHEQRIEETIYADDGDTPGWYPIAKINAKSQRTDVGYDTRYGQLSFAEDANGIRAAWYYDDFGRLAVKVDGDGTETTIDVREGSIGPIEVETTVEGGKSEIVRYDRYGRVTGSAQKGTRGDLLSYIRYDQYGRIRTRTRPHYLSELDESQSQAAVNFTFDARGREATKSWVDASGTNPVNISTHSCYLGMLRCTRNARGFTSCVRDDQLGRPLRSWDPEPIANAESVPESALPSCEEVLSVVELRPPTVQYSYGEFLEKIEDAHGNVTRIKLDRYGRRVELSDPDSGVQSTIWNAFGEVLMTTDANGQVMVYVYDALGRKLERYDATEGSSETQVTRWFYDGENPENPALEPGELIGFLTESRSPEGHAKSYAYNEVGQLTLVEQLLAGETEPLTVQYSDYAFGRPETIHYPDSGGNGLTAVRYNYGPYGHLLSVGVPAQPLWWLADTDAFDLPTEEHFGNGAVSVYGRDNLSRVEGMLDRDGDGNQIRLAVFDHDAGGNVTARAVANQVEILGYDQLDRVVSSTIDGEKRETHYDELGNITFRTEVGPYSYTADNAEDSGVFVNPTKPHAVSSVGMTWQNTTLYDYDDAGQMKARMTGLDPVQHMSWTSFGKISQMWTGAGEPEDGSNVVTFGYDADGQRILKTTEDETTTYMLDLYERRERTGGITEHVFYVGNDRRVFLQMSARTDGNSSEGDVSFLHGDVVGSPEVITGADGNLGARRSYGAFGAERDPNDWNDSASDTSSVRRGFTGHEEDREYKLVNMKGRLYDARIGRFLSADPFATMASSQHFNRFSYVLNNPLKYVDPSGYAEVDFSDVGADESEVNYTPSDDPSAESDAYAQVAAEWQAEAASNETGPNSTPFSDAGAAANADAMIQDAGTDLPSKESLSMAEGAYGLRMPDPLACKEFCAFAGPDFQDVVAKNALATSLRNVAQDPLATRKPVDDAPSGPIYVPRGDDGSPLPLPRGKNGELAPSSPYPHTQMGWQEGRRGGYVQTREFGPNNQPVKQVDWTDHFRPAQHTNPHVHDYVPNPTGGTPQHGPARPPRPGELW